MKTILIGADCEENLGLGMIAAALRRSGHRVSVQAFEDATTTDEVARAVLSRRPQWVGLAIQFQHGAAAHVALARRLRELGYRGHITCGGQHPTMAHRELLADVPAIDSVVLHEGEETVVELLAALESGGALDTVRGLAIRGPGNAPMRTQPRALSNALDDLPFAYRYRPHSRHLGLPFIPVWGSRGCWNSCAFCAITTAHREARRHAPSRLLRLRSVENLAAEMAALWHCEQRPAVFCFHDDTLLLPRPLDSLERLRSLRRALDELGVGEFGMVGKCRPDCVTPELAMALRRLGVFRMFVGIENASPAGLVHLNRRTKTTDLDQALSAFARAGIYTCFNLLLFEPDAKLEDVRQNIAFMRAHAEFPVNFCRAEAYHGTPLHQKLAERGALIGNYLGWDYRISDDRTELAFRISAAVFRERNFDALGVANRYIGIAYLAQLLKTFFDCSGPEETRVLRQARELVVAISRESADFLERVVDLAERADLGNADAIVRETARLGLELSACNRHWHAELDELEASIRRCADKDPKKRSPALIPERARAMFQQMAVAGCLVTSLPGCGGATDNGDDGQNSGGSTTHRGGDDARGGQAAGGGGMHAGGHAVGGMHVVDMAPTGGRGLVGGDDTAGNAGEAGAGEAGGGWIADPVPPNSGGRASGGFRNIGGHIVDPGGTPNSGGRATGGWISDPTPHSGGNAQGGMHVVDMAPTGGRGLGGNGTRDGGEMGGWINDPVPYRVNPATGGRGQGGITLLEVTPGCGSAVGDTNEVESQPACTGVVDPPPPPRSATPCVVDPTAVASSTGPTEHWRDTRALRLPRSQDLPLWDPPEIALRAEAKAGTVFVALCAGDSCVSTRWQAEGSLESNPTGAVWRPVSRDDQLTVCVRTEGGVAFATLRAADVPGFGAGSA